MLDFGVEGKTPFLVMSYATNGTLRYRHPKGARLPLTTVLPYIKQIADALQYSHDEKVIHRHVKPENMLVGKHQEILLSDFGIAVMAQSSHYQNPQDMAGTPSLPLPSESIPTTLTSFTLAILPKGFENWDCRRLSRERSIPTRSAR